jgi:hypothetical protein
LKIKEIQIVPKEKISSFKNKNQKNKMIKNVKSAFPF